MQKFNLKEDKIMNLDKFTIVSYDQIAGFDRQAGMLALVMDEINDFTLSQEEEKNDITGKGGRVIGSQKKTIGENGANPKPLVVDLIPPMTKFRR